VNLFGTEFYENIFLLTSKTDGPEHFMEMISKSVSSDNPLIYFQTF